MTPTSRLRSHHEPRGQRSDDQTTLEVKPLLPHRPSLSPHPSPTHPSPFDPPPSRPSTTPHQPTKRTPLLQQPYLTIAAFLLATIFITWWPGLSILTRLASSLAPPPTPPFPRPRYHHPIVHGEWYSQNDVASLPSWESHIRKLPPCTKRHASQHDLFDGTWLRTKAGEAMYEPATCRLPRLTAHEARTCLANKTLLFIGDSITRYQYVSLAHFLVHGLYPQRYADDPRHPSICLEKQFDSWPHYFAYTSDLLSVPNPIQPSLPTTVQERCNCSRPDGAVNNSTYEHHHLTVSFPTHPPPPTPASSRAPSNSSDPTDPSNPSTSNPRPPPDHLSTINIRFNLTLAWPSIHDGPIQALRHALAHNPPDTVILNIGAWFDYGPLRDFYNLSSAVAAFEPLFTPPPAPHNGTRLIWRTMSHGKLGQQVVRLSGVMDGLARYHRWEWFDSRRVTEKAARQQVALMWDNLHFLPAMYDQWNDLLLHMLCSGK